MGVKKSDALYIPSLDGIRACAVLLVFAAHSGIERLPGSFGVTVFFFLSGYLITTLLRMEFEQSGTVSFRAFYLRRTLRILPPMYLILGAASLLTAANLYDRAHLDPQAVLAQVVHLTNYYIIQHGWWDGRAPGTGIYWSLAVEEHFYLLFPVIFLGLQRHLPKRRHQAVALLATCAAILIWRVVLVYGMHVDQDRTYIATDTRVDSILFGCILAVVGNPVLDRSPFSDRALKSFLFPLSVVTLVVSFAIRDDRFQETFRYSMQGLALFPLFMLAIKFPHWSVFRVLNMRPVKFIGLLSYTLYLTHQIVLFSIQSWTTLNVWTTAVVTLGISVLLCTGIYYTVEKPCARLRRRLSRVGQRTARAHPISERTPQQMSPSPSHVSTVICTRNRPDLIGNAVRSVLANDYPEFDLLVVDQSDDPRTGEIVRGLQAADARLRYMHTTTPGLSRAYNIGIRETTGDVLAFTDDDCIAPTDWISNIARTFDAEPTTDMLYGQVLLPSALAGHSGEVPTLAIHAPEHLDRRSGFRIYGMGANYAVRRRLFHRIGGFDEALGGGGPLKSSQDFDFQYRAYLAGATVRLSPEVAIDHYGLRTREQWPATMRAYGVGDGAFYFKHVRCGDLFALRLLIKRLAHVTVREALIHLRLRRRPSQSLYLRSCLAGIRQSLSFRVDRDRRLYVFTTAA